MTFPVQQRPRVLVADDHPEIVKAICRLLALDCEVVGTVSDGSDVLGAAQRLRPDMLVIDLNLPTISGLEAVPADHTRAAGNQSHHVHGGK